MGNCGSVYMDIGQGLVKAGAAVCSERVLTSLW